MAARQTETSCSRHWTTWWNEQPHGEMMFNIPNCKIMHVGRNNPCFEYNMSGVKLTVVEEEKDIVLE